MKNINSEEAKRLLYKDVITSDEELSLDKNRWVRHSLYVGEAAGRIAQAINNNWMNYEYFRDYIKENGPLDVDYAKSLGYLHDIGRKISHPEHTTEGYKYLCKLGYNEEASITLTHSFIDNDINNSADGVSGEDRYNFINDYLHRVDLTPYDSIVQLCDLFCLETGFTTVERRLLDIAKRKGIYKNSLLHFNKTMELLSRFELDDDYQEILCLAYGINKGDINFYSLFPEISKEVLDKKDDDREELLQYIHDNMPESPITLEKK